MKTKTTLASLLLAAVMVTPSYGADEVFLQGAEDWLQGKQSHAQQFFLGYVSGFVDRATNPLVSNPPIRFPKDANDIKLFDVVALLIHNRPSSHRLRDSVIVHIAIREAWPEENGGRLPGYKYPTFYHEYEKNK